MNSENSKTSRLHVLIFKLTDKLDLRRAEKSITLSNLKKNHKTIINLKYPLQDGMILIRITRWVIFYTRYSRLF